jgi:hypothetical protein
MSRWVRFFIAILIGIAAGLLYGWVINPVDYFNTSPDSLKIDYRTDYVLMVAETYQAGNDLDLAARRLAVLGDALPQEITRQAILFAERAGYADYDLDLMRALAVALQGYTPGRIAPTGTVSP